jgi:hypothetical protein
MGMGGVRPDGVGPDGVGPPAVVRAPNGARARLERRAVQGCELVAAANRSRSPRKNAHIATRSGRKPARS